MKSTILTLIAISFSALTFAQELPGFRTSNYNGVLGIFSNPANVANNNYSWDVSLINVGIGVSNNNAKFSLKNLSTLTEGDSLVNQLLGKNGQSSNALLGIDVKPISLMIGLNRKSGIAFSTKVRMMANTTDIDGTFANQINKNEDDSSFPYTIDSDKDMRVTANAWAEFGFTYGRVLVNTGNHFIKAGVTAKYLAGAANAYVNINKLKATITQDPMTEDVYLTQSTGSVELGTAGIPFDDFDASKLTELKSTGFGADLGIVYEFRPYVKGEDKKVSGNYKFKVGINISDLGSIKYNKNLNNSGGYEIGITGLEAMNFEELSDADASNIKDVLDSKPQYFTPIGNGATSYNVSLPTMAHIDLDLNLKGPFYINAAAHVNMVTNNVFNNRNYSAYSVTPRIDTKRLGLFIPINYSELTDLNAGLAVKLGPLFLGSGSILTAMLSESKQADFYFGLRFGAFAKK